MAKKKKDEELIDEFEVSEEILVLKNSLTNKEEKIKMLQAEMINYRKRKDEEVINRLKYANEDLILELLPICDNFERALKLSDNEEINKYLEGFKILNNHLVETLKNYGVEEIPALGIEFDPKVHDAIAVGKDKTKADGIILEVILKGYTFKDKLIRPTTVKVNKLEKR